MPALEHTHEFFRITPNIYMCAHPDCSCRVVRKYLRGKRSICTGCHKNEIILGPEELRRAYPKCFECSDTREAKQAREKLDKLKEMGIEL